MKVRKDQLFTSVHRLCSGQRNSKDFPFFFKDLTVFSKDRSETLLRVVLKLCSKDCSLFFWRCWKSTKQQTMQEEFNLINQKPEAAAIDDGFPCGTSAPSYIWNIKLYSSTQVPLGLNIHMLSECVRCWK